MKESKLEEFWVNKMNSPFAELLLYFCDKTYFNMFWLAPVFIIFGFAEIVIIKPLIFIEKVFRSSSA